MSIGVRKCLKSKGIKQPRCFRMKLLMEVINEGNFQLIQINKILHVNVKKQKYKIHEKKLNMIYKHRNKLKLMQLLVLKENDSTNFKNNQPQKKESKKLKENAYNSNQFQNHQEIPIKNRLIKLLIYR